MYPNMDTRKHKKSLNIPVFHNNIPMKAASNKKGLLGGPLCLNSLEDFSERSLEDFCLSPERAFI